MQARTLGLLEDIRVAISYIHGDTAGLTNETFAADRRARQLVAHNLDVIGGTLGRLRRADSAVVDPISGHSQFVQLGNAVILEYDTIDYQSVWTLLQNSLPVLEQEVDTLVQLGKPVPGDRPTAPGN